MSRMIVLALLTASFTSTARAESAAEHRERASGHRVTFRAANRGVVTSIQVVADGIAFECAAISYRQHGRSLTVRGLAGQLQCTTEDGSVVVTAPQLEVRQAAGLVMLIGKDTSTGETAIRLYGGTCDPRIVSASATTPLRSAFSK
jgi:hypothetical protein